MNERIMELRKSLGLSQEAFAKRIGIKGSAMSLIEGGRRNITTQVVTAICREFGVNEKWLREGVGDMYVEMSRAEMATEIVGAALNTDNEFIINTFIALGRLTPDKWEVVQELVNSIKNS